MTKRTIDGLAVRSSNNQRSISAKPKKSATGLGVQKAATKVSARAGGKTAARTTATEVPAATKPQKSRKNVSFADTEEATLDWSDLLDEMSTAKKPDDLGLKKKSASAELTQEGEDWFGEEPETPKRSQKSRRGTEQPAITKKGRRAAKQAAETKKKRHVGRWVIGALSLLLVAGFVLLFFWGDGLVSRMTNGNSGLFDAIASLVSEKVPFEEDAGGRTNVVVFGTSGYNMDGASGDGTHDGAQLTDSIMVVSFDQDTQDVALMSLPRDLKVSMACSAGKINEVYWCHNQDGTSEEAGAQALMTQLTELTGLDFHYWAHINWSSLIQIVDAMGGITVTLDEDINDYYYTKVVAQAGVPITVNGEQALGLARARHGTTGGDFTRGNTQQKILMAILDKLTAQGVDLTQALSLLNILGDNLRSNFSSDNIKSGVSLVSGFSPNQIRQVPLVNYEENVYYVTSKYVNGISYVVPAAGVDNYGQIRDYVAKMFSSNPVLREGATVAVYNATEEFGVASAERDSLVEAGYNVVSVGDAPAEACAAKYCLFVLNQELSGTWKALEERYGVVAMGADVLPAGVEAGVDFVIIRGPEMDTEE